MTYDSKSPKHNKRSSKIQLAASVGLAICLAINSSPVAQAATFGQVWDFITTIGATALGGACPGCSDLIAAEVALPKLGLCFLAFYAKVTQDKIYQQDLLGPNPSDFQSEPRWNALESFRQKAGNACGGADATFAGSAVGPFDPNDKVGSQGAGSQQYVSGHTPLRYAIYFGNEATATAPAQTVVITDQLDLTHEDLQTFSLGPIAFTAELVSPPPGLTDYTTTIDLRPTSSLLVQANGHLDLSTGLLVWHLISLDPTTNQPPTDPTSGFLPPGANGSVFFTVMSKQGLATGTQVQNQATIVFDANAPMSTQSWLNTIDNAAPTSHVTALPTTESTPTFTAQWSGTDVGSGVQDYTIYVSDNGGPFTLFQTNTTATSATFSGQLNHAYGFYSIARDLVGNVEAPKTAAEATTQVELDTTPPVTKANLSGPAGNNGWYRGPVTVTLTAADPDSPVAATSYSLDGRAAVTYKAPFTIPADGIHQISFFSTDPAGNQEKPNSLTVQIDSTPPVTTASPSGPAGLNGWFRATTTVSFTATDNLSGVASTAFSLDGGASWTAGNGISLAADGIYNLSYRSTDVAGNLESAKSTTVKIDKTPPVITASASPSTLWPPNGKTVNVTVSGTITDATSGVNTNSANFAVVDKYGSVQPNGNVTVAPNGTYSFTISLQASRLGTDQNGRTYTIALTAQDNAGNQGSGSTVVVVPHDQGPALK